MRSQVNYKQKIEHLSEMARRGTQVKFLLHESNVTLRLHSNLGYNFY